MIIEFDPNKSEQNLQLKGLSFEIAEQFELEDAIIRLDIRKNYGASRFNALGLIHDRLYHLIFTIRV